jgi:hypothetical protein
MSDLLSARHITPPLPDQYEGVRHGVAARRQIRRRGQVRS